LKTIFTIAFKEFRDRLRSGWVIACVAIWLAAILLTSFFGLIQIGRIGAQGYERTTASLLNLTQYLAPLLGLLVGHDVIIREREERTLHLILACGIRRAYLPIAKFLGAALTVSLPLLAGFVVAGALIGAASHDVDFVPFFKMTVTAVALGIIFAGIGTVVSTIARSRVQALVCALLAWGIAVFAFDLAALGIIVSQKAPQSSQEIEVVCDATHVNAQADIHSAFDTTSESPKTNKSSPSQITWLFLNPVDVFRVINLPRSAQVSLPLTGAFACATVWIALSLVVATMSFKVIDL
jgi:Cu-processing system permease protein